MPKDANSIRDALSKPFAPEDLEWRIQQAFEDKGRGLAVPYVTNRAIQDRLDEVVGPENWHNEFRPWHGNGKRESQICGLSIYFEGRGFITKWDGAEDTDIEAVKGGLSDSMKRAAVQWGIGRILYKMDTVWVDIERRGRSWFIKSSERAKLDKAYLALLEKLHLTCAKPGALQSELTPGAVSRDGGSAGKAQFPAQERSPSDKTVKLPVPDPAWEYAVAAVSVQTGASGSMTTSLTLKGRDGKTVKAFARGADSRLIPNAKLKHVKLTMKQQSSVVFYVLEHYEVLDLLPQAA